MKAHSRYYLAGAVALLTFAVYLPALQNNFVEWDDNIYVYENPHIRFLDTAFLRWAFLDFHAANWHPLTWISHALDYAVWGLDPMGHHLTNNILHSVNTFLVVLLVVKLLETVNSRQYEVSSKQTSEEIMGYEVGSKLSAYSLVPTAYLRFTLIAAGVTGLLFGLHPLHVESVAWVAERKDLLCALFYLLSIMAYIKSQSAQGIKQRAEGKGHSVEHGGIPPHSPLDKGGTKGGWFFFTLCSLRYALCFFILALLSKPMAVSLPIVLLILDWYPIQRVRSLRTFLFASAEKVPFFALSVASSAITVLAQKSGESIASMEAVPFSLRVPVAFQSLTAYLGKMILPLHLLPFYPYPRNVSLSAPEFLLPIVLVAGITLAAVMVSRKQGLWLSAWSYYLVILIPVLGIIQVGSQSMADRYTYLPSLGPFLVAGIMAAWLYEKAEAPRQRGLLLRAGWIALATAGLILISYASIRQLGVWNNGLALWNYVIEEKPLEVPQAYNNRGFILLQKGLADEAIADLQVAVSLDPAYADAYNNLCLAYKSKGLYGKAIEQCRTAIGLKPNYAEARNNLGTVYKHEGLVDKAVEQYLMALRLKPDYAEAFFNLGIVYLDKGDLETARWAFEEGLKFRPDDYKARQVLNRIISR